MDLAPDKSQIAAEWAPGRFNWFEGSPSLLARFLKVPFSAVGKTFSIPARKVRSWFLDRSLEILMY
jgi:hypothetical protein